MTEPVFGIQLAVMPIEDLSKGDNGLSPAMTGRLREALIQKGYAVCDEKRIIDFMARNKIRWVGRLDFNNILLLRKELGIDYLLLGSVNQVRESEPAALGVALEIVRASDAKMVWAGSAQLCRADIRKFLGLDEPKNISEIEDIVVKRVMENFPQKLQERTTPPSENLTEDIRLTPEVVKPGAMVSCRIRLGESDTEQTVAAVSVIVGEKIVKAVYLAQGQYYEAVWPAVEKDGRYPVVVEVDRGKLGRKNVFAGSFQIDGQPPEIGLFLRGQELDGEIVLNKQLIVIPFLRNPEPLVRWEVSILDASGEVVRAESGQGNLPERFYWFGQRQDGVKVEDGLYTVQVTAWDRAGNKAATSEKLRVLRKQPELNIVSKKQGDNIQVALSCDDKVPVVFWGIELRDASGAILLDTTGEKLPAQLTVPVSNDNEKIFCRVYWQDVLGNKLQQVIDNILSLKSGGDKTEEQDSEKDAEGHGWAVDF